MTMKRFTIALVILALVAAGASAQLTISEFQTAFQGFADGVAGSLASTATAGLNWSPAYIGQFPHLGVGVTLGATMIPYKTVQPVFAMLGVSLPPELAFMQTYGVPLPAAALDARIGGFGIPFDVGLKFGIIPEQLKASLGGVKADYLIVGGDLRLALLKDEGMMPALSVGVGYSYLKGSVAVAGLVPVGQSVDISGIMNPAGYPGTHVLSLSNPDVGFQWESNVIEAKVQLSKSLLILTPHVGLSAAYGMSSAGGGLSSTLTYTVDGSPGSMTDVQTVFAQLGYPAPTSQGFAVVSSSKGWAFRLFGGVSVNLLLLRLDLGGSYNLLTGSYGGSANVRVQL